MTELKENPEHQLTKYQELYTLAKGAFAEEFARSASIERKAANYISILTFLIGIFSLLSRQVFAALLPPKDLLSWLILVLFTGFFGLMVWSWFLLFRILRLYHYRKLPIPLEFFHENKLATVYYGMAKGIRENLEVNRKHGDKKGKFLDKAYDRMRLMVILLVALCILFGAHAWFNLSANPGNHSERRNQMTEETTNSTSSPRTPAPETPAPQEGEPQPETLPDVEVAPPTFDITTNVEEPLRTRVISPETGEKRDGEK